MPMETGNLVGESSVEDDELPIGDKNVSRSEGSVKTSVATESVGTTIENEEEKQLSGSEVDSSTEEERASTVTYYEQVNMAEKDIMSFNKGFVKITGMSLNLAIIRALLVKKAILTWRNRVVTLAQLLLPVIFTALGLATDVGRSVAQMIEPPLILNLEPFGQTYIPFTVGLNATPAHQQFADLYKTQFGSSENLEEFQIGKPPYKTFDNYTLRRASQLGLSTFNRKVIIGMSVIDPTGSETSAAVAFYNGHPYHSRGIAVRICNLFKIV
ncbi:ATP-binding cassette, sub-family a (abc1), member 3b [Plakobranchus ocellatus]|uniref:ATP-binding cassette, sub-family a (Abc1), member 3b n=1 Tax=Plakobranchus ocellatus TaxID=259542 RepID=A0AAV4D5T2_9GAST|nr:ATP-binding cassette, sub-family a (abc1), member 3b [Plakobranchus ocellatus]